MNNRRRGDAPLLVLSQDYELFFGVSGTPGKCLFEPCDALLAFASANDSRITFYVDAGMLLAMRRYESGSNHVRRQRDDIRNHINSLARAGHEIGLHVHPHWEDTRWADDGWDFSATRYQLREFSDAEIAEIMRSYTHELAELAEGAIASYRAGGFCVEPFERIGGALKDQGISIDSSVVPGAKLKDAAKGFDFSDAPGLSWWHFSGSPAVSDSDGEFCEVAITPLVLPVHHYWGRLFSRLGGKPSAASAGDGVSKAIGKREIIRRLLGAGRISELSIDAAKAHHLVTHKVLSQPRNAWQIMGHPKLLGQRSLTYLAQFMEHFQIRSSMTVSEFARLARDLPREAA